MHPRGALLALALVLLSACGASTGLLTPPLESIRGDGAVEDGGSDAAVEGGVDAETDATFPDAGDAAPDAFADGAPDVTFGDDAATCHEGQNTEYAPADCSGTTSLWLAGPYRSARDISVDRIEIHTTGGNIAILTSVGGAPGALLFMGAVGPSASPEWLGVTVSPPVQLHAGTQYFLANQESYCSQTLGGPDDIEYGAPTLEGPWTVTGTDNWTARLSGTCP